MMFRMFVIVVIVITVVELLFRNPRFMINIHDKTKAAVYSLNYSFNNDAVVICGYVLMSVQLKTGVKLYGGLTRKQQANLIRLRTGHCRLNSYLNKRKIIEDPTCECGPGIENVKHFLLLCKKYEEPRNELR